MIEQLSFDLPAKPVLGRDDFYVSPANALAVATVEMPHWPGGKLALTGPGGSGKTHLAHVFSDGSDATIIHAEDLVDGLTNDEVTTLSSGPLVIDSVPKIAGNRIAEEAIFHLHNLTLANGYRLLMTGRPAPRHWGLELPDLQSRAQGTHHIALEQPDDSLLAAVMAKLFADRQVVPRADVIPYLVANMPRSFEDAANIVSDLDRVSLSEKRSLTRPLAVRLLSESRNRP
jgi:chromosomal replication initiation ATPase DnaA